jgi:lipopolysaccharide/colanic/teichoic acid biosynthesis glycosyltransferase
VTAEEVERYEKIGRGLGELVPIAWQKRAFDIAFSLLLLVILSPIILLILAGIAVDGALVPGHRGPFFLTEERGWEGKIFHLPKFRIIRMDAFQRIRKTQKCQHTKPIESDPDNVTSAGVLLKKFYLDEWPQLFSILKGDMSFVGPRPWPFEPYYTRSSKRAFSESD